MVAVTGAAYEQQDMPDILANVVARTLSRAHPELSTDFAGIVDKTSSKVKGRLTARNGEAIIAALWGELCAKTFYATVTEGDTNGFNARFGHLMTPALLTAVTRTIANRLRKAGGGMGDHDDLAGWAQMGLAAAIAEYDGDRSTAAPIQDPKKWVCAFLGARGYYRALDEMRACRACTRTRRGKTYGQRVKTQSMGEMEVASCTDDFVPADAAEMAEHLIGGLTGIQRTVFEQRFINGAEPSEIAARVGVTSARVYQILNSTLQKLRLQHCN